MAKHNIMEDVMRRNIPPVDFELADVDPRPIDLRKAREAFPRI